MWRAHTTIPSPARHDDLSSCGLVLPALLVFRVLLQPPLDAIFMLVQKDAHPAPSRAKIRLFYSWHRRTEVASTLLLSLVRIVWLFHIPFVCNRVGSTEYIVLWMNMDGPCSRPSQSTLCTNLSQPSCYLSSPQWPSPPYHEMKKFTSSRYLRLTALPVSRGGRYH